MKSPAGSFTISLLPVIMLMVFFGLCLLLIASFELLITYNGG